MNRQYVSASVVVGNTTTNPISLNSWVPTSLIVSGSVLTGTSLTFVVSDDNVTYYPLFDETSTEVSLTFAGSPRAYNLNPSNFWGWNFLKIREGTSASAKAQATYDALLKIAIQPF